MNDLNWKVIGGFVFVALLFFIVGYATAPSETTGLTDTEVKAKIGEAVNQTVFQKNAEIETLRGLLEKSGNETIEDEKIEKETGYLIDELYLNTLFGDTYSDREVNLFDGEVEFDNDDYDAEETFILKDITLLANENDFGGNVYMTVPEGTIEYKFEFEANLNTSLIDEDETLVFDFLGEEIEISEWDIDEITFSKGKEVLLSKGESVEGVKLDMVLEDSIYVIVDGEGEKIYEGDTERVNGIEVKVKEVLYDPKEGSVSKAILVIGKDIEETFSDGEEYEDDSIWEWKISANSIGLVLKEDFTEIDKDGDEEFPAVGVDEKLCLPNDYKCVIFNGMGEVDTEEYLLELDEKSGNEYVRIKGNFISGIEDYSRIYVNVTGIYDKDLKLIDSDEIELANTDSVLDISGGELVFEDFEVNFALDTTNVVDDEEDYLTDYGILVVDPEDSLEDQEFEISVPEKQIEGSITLI